MLNIQNLAHYAQNSAQNLGIKQYDIYGSSVEEAGVGEAEAASTPSDRGMAQPIQENACACGQCHSWSPLGFSTSDNGFKS
jgi:hypothetical protein